MKILVVVDSINIEDSSGSKANVALILNLVEAGFEVQVYHYTLKDIQLAGVRCIAIPEIKYSVHYFFGGLIRVLDRKYNMNPNHFFEKLFGFSFTFFNDTNSIVKALQHCDFHPDLVLTLSKGASFRPHYAILKLTELHPKWMAYVHDPYPFHFYPPPYTWKEGGSRFKEEFFEQVSKKAKYSAFPSQLLMEWMSSFYPNFKKNSVLIPHQNAEYTIQNSKEHTIFPKYFDATKFNLLHAGNLMKQRSPQGLIEGFKLFLKQNPFAKIDAKLILLGNASNHSKMLEGYQNDNPEIYIYNGNIAFDIVYQLQKSVSVNIILESKSEISPFLPAKFPHCVGANKTILSLAPYYSETRRLLGDNYEFWAEQDDILRIAALIQKMYLLWKNNPNNLLLNRKDLEHYLSSDYLKKVILDLKNN